MAYEAALLALADPTRRQVFEHLRLGPRSVGDIAAEMPVSRPAVSQHLKVLKDAGLVADIADGTRRVYSIDHNGLGELRSWLDQFWDEALQAFKAHVERAHVERAHVDNTSTGKPDEPATKPAHDPRRARTQAAARQRRRRPRV